jgi:hypothetical protein
MCPLSGGDRGYDRDIVKNGERGGDGRRHKGPERVVGGRQPFLNVKPWVIGSCACFGQFRALQE